MDGLHSLSFAPGVITWGVLTLTWLVERVFPINSTIDPIAFFRFICDRMAAKVLPTAQQTQQHFISGTLAAIVLIVPIVMIVALVAEFASIPWMFDAIALYVCLQFSQQSQILIQINSALKKNKKQLARDLLKPSVLRETAMLSEVGLNKAGIEMYVLRLVYQQAVVLFWFILLGPIAALIYRMSYEVSQSWNTKLQRFVRFGWFSHLISGFFQWLPARLFSIIILSLSGSISVPSNLKRFFSSTVLLGSNGGVPLAAIAIALNKNISGPVMYDHKKIRRIKYTMSGEPTLSDAPIAVTICLRAIVGFLGLLLLISWGLYV